MAAAAVSRALCAWPGIAVGAVASSLIVAIAGGLMLHRTDVKHAAAVGTCLKPICMAVCVDMLQAFRPSAEI